MNILILGSGGREHAFAWKLSQSPRCARLYVAPGNAGTAQIATNIPIAATDFAALSQFATENAIDMVVIGPEQPLVEGIADKFEAMGIPAIGPKAEGAILEGSKDFSKKFMQRHNIPTAGYASFMSAQTAEALAYVAQHPLPIVVKASGLAAGKGVLICETHAEAATAVAEMLAGTSFGEAGTTVVIEEFLAGIEISVFVLTDGKSYKILPSAKDYKRIGEGDTGLNTGGMGAISPVPFADEAFMEVVERTIVQPTVAGFAAEGIDFRGFVFIGLMVVGGKPIVLEYNVRMGDPETEVVLPRLESDLLDLFEGVATQTLHEKSFQVKSLHCATTMLVSGGYPGDYEKGKPMSGFAADFGANIMAFHAGTKPLGDAVVTDGGRVLAVSAYGESLREAVAASQAAAAHIHFEGSYFRRDIGFEFA